MTETVSADGTTRPAPAPDRADLSSVARGGTLNLVGAVVAGVLTFAFYVLVARALDKAEVGAYFVATAVYTIAATTCQLGAHTGLVRFIPQFRVESRYAELRPMLRIALVPVLAVGTAVGVLLYVGAPELALYVSHGQNEQLVQHDLRGFAPFVPVLSAFTVLISGLQGFGNMRPSVLTDRIGRAGLQVVGGLGALVAGGSAAFVGAWAVPYAFGLVAAGGWVLRLIARPPARPGQPRVPVPRLAWTFWRFSGPRGMANVFQVLVLWLDTVLISLLSTTEQAGIYAVATRYLLVGTLAVGALLQVMGPKVSELFARGDLQTLRSVYQSSVAWLMAIVWPIYLVMVIFSPTLLTLFGPQYVLASGALSLLAAALLFSVACGPVDIVLLMSGRSWYSAANWGLGLAVNVGLDLWLIPRHGMMGAAVGWSVSIVARNVAPLLEVGLLLKLHPFGRGFGYVVVASVVSYGGVAGAVRLWMGTSVLSLGVAVALGTAVYAAVCYRVRRVLDLDLLLRTLLRSVARRRAPAVLAVP